MAFLMTSLGSEPLPSLRGHGLVLRPPVTTDYEAWAQLRGESRAHLMPFEPAWATDELSRWAFRRRVRHHQREQREDLGYAFLLFRHSDATLIGGLTLGNVRRGVTQAAALGYWLGQRFTGQGHMTGAVQLACAFAFDELRLHRIEAACLPHNQPSIRVLERCGFQHEGLARKYLKIDGAWRDHLVYARLVEDPAPMIEVRR